MTNSNIKTFIVRWLSTSTKTLKLVRNTEAYMQHHLKSFQPRSVLHLPIVSQRGWTLKRYAILADGKELDRTVVSAASNEAVMRLPDAGRLDDADGNHGIGFQIIHFAEVGIVTPVFFWQWGSVLANLDQMRASWRRPTAFGDGKKEVIGCVWEMEIVHFEVNAWKTTLLGNDKMSSERLSDYLERRCPEC